MDIVFLDAATMGDVSMEPISSLGELTCHRTSTRAEALERVRDAEVIIVNKVLADRELIDAAPRLKLICVAATGVNNVDLDYAAFKGIPVRNAVGYSTESVVQTTFMIILALVGKCRYFDDFIRTGEYSRSEIFTNVENMFF
ncbi:MAG: hydroxyacid dehydrogenase, partial [Bacteroidales bacterium]|nr:hydroxyacid dehydrogenase [Bacteroidales bacterium]